jgi:uncharacterized membrane protein
MPAPLFLILLGILAAALAVYSLVKYSRLKDDFETLWEANRRQDSEQRRQISEIAQLTARLHRLETAAGTEHAAGEARSSPSSTVAPASSPSAEINARPTKLPMEGFSSTAPNAASPLSRDQSSVPRVQEKPAPTPPLVSPPPKPADGAAATKTPAREAHGPLISDPQVPARRPAVIEPKPQPPAPPSAARISTPAAASLRYSAPQPSLAQKIKKVSALEETVGRDWLNKLGIVILVLGVAFFGIYEFSTMGAAGKAAISFATAVSMLIGGVVFEKRESYRLLGRTLIGGGWALLFFTSYGIHHVAAMRILDSLSLDSLLMLLVAVGMGAHTLRYRSQLVTGLAFLLAYTTVALSQDTVYSLSAGVFLAIGLVVIVLKMGWFELEVFGILSSYLNHLYWLYRLLGIDGAQGHPFPEYRASLAMLLFYWLAFRISYVVRKIKNESEENVSTAAALLNTLLLLATMRFQSVQPELAYLALLAIGLLEFSFAQLPITKRRRRAFVLLTVMGAALMIAAPPFHFSANNVVVLWLLGAELFLIAGMMVKEVVFRRIGLLTGFLIGIHLAFFDFQPILKFRESHDDVLVSSGVLFGLCAAVFYANFLAGKTGWEEFFEVQLDSWLLQAHSYIGAASAVVAAWALTSQDWTAVAFAGVMLTLVLLARRFPIVHTQAQYAAIGLIVLFRASAVNLHADSVTGGHLVLRQVTLPILAGAFYLSAKLAPLRDSPLQHALRGVFAAIGSAFIALLVWYEFPAPWVAVDWIAFAVVLVLAGGRLSYSALVWQANVLALLAALRTFAFNYAITDHFWSSFNLRIVTVSLVAAGLYFIARRASPSPAARSFVAYLHSFVATGLLAFLGWYESPNGWLAPLWAGFALVLAVLDRRFELPELGWQAHILSLCALLRCVAFNLHVSEQWHGFSVRLISLALVALVLYAMSRVVRMPGEWRDRDLHHAYSWAASTLISLMLWYELVPLNIAVGWAVFGLVLFEYGTFRSAAQFRYQSYVALLASFARIFFANLTAGEPGSFWNPRTYTILPLVLIYFFVYAQSPSETPSENTGSKPKQSATLAGILATLGTATVVALFYFQFSIEWVVTAWAALVVVLLGITFLLNRSVFLYQGLLLTLIVFFRGMAHNLFGAGYFTQGDWSGRFMVLGSAIALLFSSLVFAFPLRERYKDQTPAFGGWGVIAKLASRPEQLQFFVPVILLTIMLAMKMRAGMVTVSWGVEGVMVILLALALHERSFRLTGLGLLLLCVGKVLALDVWGLQPRDRYLTFIIVGAALVFVSYLYSRYRDAIRQLL